MASTPVSQVLAQFGQAMLQFAQRQQQLTLQQAGIIQQGKQLVERSQLGDQIATLKVQRQELANIRAAQGIVDDFAEARVQDVQARSTAAQQTIDQQTKAAETRFNTSIKTLNRFAPQSQRLDAGAVLAGLVASQSKDPEVRQQLLSSVGGQGSTALTAEQQSDVEGAVDTALEAFKAIRESTQRRESLAVPDLGAVRQEAVRFIAPRVAKRLGVPPAELGVIPETSLDEQTAPEQTVVPGPTAAAEPPAPGDIESGQAAVVDSRIRNVKAAAARIKEIDDTLLARSSGPNGLPVSERLQLRQERETLVKMADALLAEIQGTAEAAGRK